ncbi:MAG: TIGR02391 family protein [Dehalococcoidia bacterium]
MRSIPGIEVGTAAVQGIRAAVVGVGLHRSRSDVPDTLQLGPMHLYDELITESGLREVSRSLFEDGHFARAVEEAYKFLNNEVKRRAGSNKDGPDLMHHAFSEEKPLLKLNALRSTSERDEQAGYRFMFAGSMSGVRNPRAHEHDLRDRRDAALELLVAANHLLRILGKAKRARPRRGGA